MQRLSQLLVNLKMILRLYLVSAVIFLFLLLCFEWVFAQGVPYTIKGKIISTLPIEQLQDIPVVLLRLNKEASPPMLPIQRSKTNERGEYTFKNIIPEASTEYLIGALIGKERIASKPIKLGARAVQVLNIEFSGGQNDNFDGKVSLDLSAIIYTNRLLIFHLLENFIRITEIIQIQNNKDVFISSQEQPLKITLPKNYQNFASFQVKDELLTSEVKDGDVFLTFQVPPAKSSLYFEYDLPFKTELTYTHPTMIENIPLNILFDQRYLEVVVLGEFLEFNQHGRYTIGAFTKPPLRELQINIHNKILPRRLFYIFGAVFFALTTLSLVIFKILLSKKKFTSH